MARTLDETAYGEKVAQTKPAPLKKAKEAVAQAQKDVTDIGAASMAAAQADIAAAKASEIEGDIAAKTAASAEEAIGKPGASLFYASDGTGFTTSAARDAYQNNINQGQYTFQPATVSDSQAQRQSAYDLLYSQFKQYGLESLVEPLKNLITDPGVSPAEFTLRLRNTDDYKKRFAANQTRIQKGLTALSEAEYLGMEDAYQGLMRQYGLPASYYTKGDLGRQEGFEKLIANDVSASELEDRIATAQQRVMNTNPEVLRALRQFYPDLGSADILAYTLNPEQGLADIKRKVTAAEIGGAALAQGLQAGQASAEALAGYGITKQQAQQGYQTIAEMAPRGSQLAAIYGQTPYTQQTAEAEVFGTAGAAQSAEQRKKLKALEEASFGGSSGVGALGKDTAPYRQQTFGAGQY